MTSPIGYNNPAYSHQFDSSLYEYQYVPDIDPEFDGQPDDEHEQIHLVHPNIQDEFSGASEEFDASDESNQSIIVEECNNRRITLICDKRSKAGEKFYEDRDYRGAYHHDISLESENDYRASREDGRGSATVSQRHTRKLEPPDTDGSSVGGYFPSNGYPPGVNRNAASQYHRSQRSHRYEEIGGDDEYDEGRNRMHRVSRHRYAEILMDENGYPSIGNEIEIERNDAGYRVVNMESQIAKPIAKPRAASPVGQSFSPTFSPSKTYQRTISPRPPNPEASLPRMVPVPPVSLPSGVIEMSELSPPRTAARVKPNQSPFCNSPKRQPPIGASAPADLQEQLKSPSGKGSKPGKPTHKRQHSAYGQREVVTPSKSTTKPGLAQMFQAKGTPKSSKPVTPSGKAAAADRSSIRRNISNSFTDPPRDPRGPYRPTTVESDKAKTAIITPILQRKTGRSDDEDNFRRMSHTFQSTGNLCKAAPDSGGYQSHRTTEARIKRNQSVPNFAQSLASEANPKHSGGGEPRTDGRRSTRKLDYQYSPAKSVDRFSPISRSRLSLIDQRKLSWSYSGSDFRTANSGCLIIGAVIQIITSVASCAICFYLFSRLGRRYYLDFGILAGFVNLVLGILGFRSQCWKWLPNRNYVSGYIVLTAFSIITCAGFVYLITARPMSGDPVLDLIGGGICGVSVLTIILSITGLTMSGCCKSPPPDNRVTNI